MASIDRKTCSLDLALPIPAEKAMPRAQSSRSTTVRHQPLERDILGPQDDIMKPPKKLRTKRRTTDNDEVEHNPRISQKILDLAMLQQAEMDADSDKSGMEESIAGYPSDFRDRVVAAETSDEDDDLDETVDYLDDDLLLDLGMKTEDGAAFESLHPTDTMQRRTLADFIFLKLDSGDSNDPLATSKPQNQQNFSPSDPAFGVDPKVVAMFEMVGEGLRGTGLLHKSIKALPSFPQWKRYLALTHPENWSPFMTCKITNVFMSNMNTEQAQFFLCHVLLPAVREDIASPRSKKNTNRKLDVHLYEALLKALYKPAPFFKGVLFPVLDEGCTLKEAVIFASVLSKKSIPAVHIGVVLLKLAEQDFSGPRALIIRVLLEKKKDLPYKALDGLVFHFIRVANTHKKGELPVLWHQSLLVFVQRYAAHLTDDQQNSLLDVVRVHYHKDIGSEIRRELMLATARNKMGL